MRSTPKRKTSLPARPILVTGATGFLGGHLVRRLIADGVPVRATGRRLPAGLALQALGADFRPVDLRDRAATVAACEGVRSVVHAGALSSAWGRREDFFAINVGGTENVIEGCLRHGVARLVYISSPSVLSRFAPQIGLTEDAPLPRTFVSVYSETKAVAETRVRAAQARGLAAVILRPKAIYGPGDNAIFPRVLRAAKAGRLAKIGDGGTVTNLTYVDDVVQAILLALEKPAAVGRTFLVTGGQDVKIWDVILDLLKRLGIPEPARAITSRKAMAIAAVLETTWRKLSLPGEPPLTRYSAGILAYSQTYDITAAREVLGYVPKVTIAEGVEHFLASLKGGTGDAPAPARPAKAVKPARVEIEILNAGVCRVKEATFLPGGGWRTIDVPALFALIRHPREGVVLFDTGYSPRFVEATRAFPNRVYRWLTPARIADDETAVAQLRARGVAADEVRWIVMSHFDPDHYGGLMDFPAARVACSWRAWDAIAGKKGLELLRMRVLPGHLPADLSARLLVLPDPDGPAIGPFDASLDLFGDGAIRLVPLPGHAPGQMGAFVTGADGRAFFLAADGCWSLANVEGDAVRGGVHRLFAHDKAGQDDTYRRLARLVHEYPEITVVPAHCPKAAAKVGAR